MNQPLPSRTLAGLLNAKDFRRCHGSSLAELLHATVGIKGLKLYCEFAQHLDCLSPEPNRVRNALCEMRDLLASVRTPENQYADLIRWHGPRLDELAAGLSH